MLSELWLGILTNLISDTVKKPLKDLALSVSRRRAASRAIGRPEERGKSRGSETAENLRCVLANDFGEYTQKVESFLIELSQSSIVDSLRERIICGMEHGDIFDKFCLLYEMFKPMPFTAEQLFGALVADVSVSVAGETEDPALFEYVTRQHVAVMEKISELGGIVDGNSHSLPITWSEYTQKRLDVARHVEQDTKYIHVETTQGSRRVALKKIVVDARLNVANGLNDFPLPHREIQEDHRPNISYINFKQAVRKAVIVGDPGGGKSTLVRKLCFDLSNQYILSANRSNYARFDKRDLRTPVRVIVRAYEKALLKSRSYSLLDYIIDDFVVVFDGNREKCKSFVVKLLSLGHAFLLFDGLDEVLDISTRQEIVSKIEAFSVQYSACSTIVTSRIVGYRDAPLCEDFEILTLSRLNQVEVSQFAYKLISAMAKKGERSLLFHEKTTKFMQQTERNANDLRDNPLLLGLMVYIFDVRGDVPDNRPEIYKECALLMFEKWDQRRDIIFKFPDDFDLLDLFGYLAAQIFGDADAEEGVSTEWLMKRLRGFFDSWYEDKARSVLASKLLVRFITDRAWVMCEIGPNVYKFTHRTFLEYFFARRLEDLTGAPSVLVEQQLFDKVRVGQWEVVAHLALQLATFRSTSKAGQALDSLLKCAQDRCVDQKEKASVCFFIASALAYLVVPESKIGSTVEYLVDELYMLNGAPFGIVIDVLHRLVLAMAKREEFFKKKFCSIIKGYLFSSDENKRYFAMGVLTIKYSGGGYYFQMPHDEMGRYVYESLADLRRSEESKIYELIQNDLRMARLYYYVFKRNAVSLAGKFGPVVFFHPKEEPVLALNVSPAVDALLDSIAAAGVSSSFVRISGVVEPDIAPCCNMIWDYIISIYRSESEIGRIIGFDTGLCLEYFAGIRLVKLSPRKRKAIEKPLLVLCILTLGVLTLRKTSTMRATQEGQVRRVIDNVSVVADLYTEGPLAADIAKCCSELKALVQPVGPEAGLELEAQC